MECIGKLLEIRREKLAYILNLTDVQGIVSTIASLLLRGYVCDMRTKQQVAEIALEDVTVSN